MAIFALSNFSKTPKSAGTYPTEQETFTYKDLDLDIRVGSDIYNRQKRDIEVYLDENAVKTSLTNMFQTKKGEKIYTPEFGFNIYKYVFEPVSSFRAKLIGEEILREIETYEPRVRVEKVYVEPLFDDHQYNITLILKIPIVSNKEFSFSGILNREGFSI